MLNPKLGTRLATKICRPTNALAWNSLIRNGALGRDTSNEEKPCYVTSLRTKSLPFSESPQLRLGHSHQLPLRRTRRRKRRPKCNAKRWPPRRSPIRSRLRSEEGKDSPGPTAADAERLKRRPGERIGQDPRGRSQVLGMFLQEIGKGGVKVVEVGAASPAFDAGVREGDELVAFDGFQASTYRKWIDGMRKLATAAPDNSMLPVVVMRNGARFATEIRVPEAHATAIVKLPTGPLPQVAQGEAPQQAAAVAIAGGGPGVSIDNSAFNSFINNDPSARSERAIAELFRVGNTAKPPVADDIASGGTAPRDKNARIGLAGFRNDANGMTVMVDVGGLQPGNYTVTIAEPSVAGLQLQPDVPPVGQQPAPGAARPQQRRERRPLE